MPKPAAAKRYRIVVSLLATALLATAALTMSAAAAAPATPTVADGLPRVEPAPVKWFERPAGFSVRIYVPGGYCVGEPRPVIDHITRHEHRLPGRSKFAAVIRVFLERPALPEAQPSPAPRAGEGPPTVTVCAGVEHSLYARVYFHRRADELVFFDGSHSPPARIPER